jgi:two-component system, chemotaxis family, response regulator PixH
VHKLLVIDDDPAICSLIKVRMTSSYEVIATGNPEEGLGLALEHKPAAILLDLLMPGFSGFELCQSFHSLSYTSRIPIFVVTGESGSKFREYCQQLGAVAYFEKPINFANLKYSIEQTIRQSHPERRAHLRVQMNVPLLLTGTDANGRPFEETTTTENISAGGFLSICSVILEPNDEVRVHLTGSFQRYVGRALVVRQESQGTSWQKYGFHFIDKNDEWILQ